MDAGSVEVEQVPLGGKYKVITEIEPVQARAPNLVESRFSRNWIPLPSTSPRYLLEV